MANQHHSLSPCFDPFYHRPTPADQPLCSQRLDPLLFGPAGINTGKMRAYTKVENVYQTMHPNGTMTNTFEPSVLSIVSGLEPIGNVSLTEGISPSPHCLVLSLQYAMSSEENGQG
ncbi:hypothetical protein N7535_003505 [Penicillium sp. DV-2018c]|nr:hypothetical protein N7535_003505 [Penicillium sp. DV-2018c]